jgi:carbamoylphosphate synthase large subunit
MHLIRRSKTEDLLWNQKKQFIIWFRNSIKNGTYKEGTAVVEIKAIIEQSNIRYPFIAKPDVGLRGSGVKKINTLEDLEQYALRQILIL